MFVKKILLTGIATIGLSFSFLAHAELTVSNQTNQPSTSRINDGYCSTDILGADGITPPHTSKPIEDWKIDLACMGNYENCKADIYMTNNCTGPAISTVIFSKTSGIKYVSPPVAGYAITWSPFAITITGGAVLSK
jgi:hypothetical protein